jgi:hypothetical protein
MKFTLLVLATLLIIVTIVSGCYNRNEADLYPEPTNCDTSNVTFSGTIQPILKQHCAITGCHTGSDPTGGYNYDTYPDVHKVASLGLLLNVINHRSGYPQMPRDAAKLDDCTIDKFTAWVNEGALDN